MAYEIGGVSPVPGPWQGEPDIDEARARPGVDRAVPCAARFGAAGASVRACLKEAIDGLWSRMRVKRRKASFGWVSWPPAAMPGSCRSRGAYWRRDRGEVSASCPGRSAGFRPCGRYARGQVTEVDGPAEVGGSRTTGRRGNAR